MNFDRIDRIAIEERKRAIRRGRAEVHCIASSTKLHIVEAENRSVRDSDRLTAKRLVLQVYVGHAGRCGKVESVASRAADQVHDLDVVQLRDGVVPCSAEEVVECIGTSAAVRGIASRYGPRDAKTGTRVITRERVVAVRALKVVDRGRELERAARAVRRALVHRNLEQRTHRRCRLAASLPGLVVFERLHLLLNARGIFRIEARQRKGGKELLCVERLRRPVSKTSGVRRAAEDVLIEELNKRGARRRQRRDTIAGGEFRRIRELEHQARVVRRRTRRQRHTRFDSLHLSLEAGGIRNAAEGALVQRDDRIDHRSHVGAVDDLLRDLREARTVVQLGIVDGEIASGCVRVGDALLDRVDL